MKTGFFQDFVSIWTGVSKKRRFQIFLIVILTIFCYTSVLNALVRIWWNDRSYAYGFLVIPITLYLVWVKRESLTNLRLNPNPLCGLSIILLAGLILLAGKAGSVLAIQELSLIVMIAGLILLLLGIEYLKALALPITYLLFMFPIFDVAMELIQWPFQLFSAKLGVLLLQSLGYAVFLQNQFIELPRITLEVAEECSGLRYLTSIVAIGIPLAYLTQKNWLRRVFLVGAAVIIAILSNGLRVMFVGIVAYNINDGSSIHGPFHIFQGMFVSWIGFIVLFTGAWLFSKIPVASAKEALNKETLVHQTKQMNNRRFDFLWLASVIILLAVGSCLYLYKTKPISRSEELGRLPLILGDWEGKAGNLQDHPFRIQGADREIMRIYRGPTGREVSLYIGYFESQRQDKKLINYLTREIHRDAEEFTIPIDLQPSLRVNKTIIRKDNVNYLTIFWYDLNGREVTGRWQGKFWTILNAIKHGRDNGAILLVSEKIENVDELPVMLEYEKRFIKAFTPITRKLLK